MSQKIPSLSAATTTTTTTTTTAASTCTDTFLLKKKNFYNFFSILTIQIVTHYFSWKQLTLAVRSRHKCR